MAPPNGAREVPALLAFMKHQRKKDGAKLFFFVFSQGIVYLPLEDALRLKLQELSISPAVGYSISRDLSLDVSPRVGSP